MPIYQYQCPVCNVVIEMMMHESERNKKLECKTCNVPMERMIHPTVLIHKCRGTFNNIH